jgi:mono/diheme cytochrome c family protein
MGMLQAASFLSQQPDLSFDIPEPARQESWLLTTYLDEVSAGCTGCHSFEYRIEPRFLRQ